MRMLKLIILGGLGYLLYKLFSDMPPTAMAQRMGQRSGGIKRQGAMDVGTTPSGPQMTGPGVGDTVETAEPGGTSVRHRVGRGVVAR